MKTIKKVGAQGDVMFVRLGAATKTAQGRDTKKVDPTSGRLVVAHSETGHHHTVQADGRVELREESPFIAYLRSTMPIEVVHERSFDTHETLKLAPGCWQVKRQREYTPQGYRRAQD